MVVFGLCSTTTSLDFFVTHNTGSANGPCWLTLVFFSCKLLFVNILLSTPLKAFSDNFQRWLGDFLLNCIQYILQLMKERVIGACPFRMPSCECEFGIDHYTGNYVRVGPLSSHAEFIIHPRVLRRSFLIREDWKI